MSECAVLKIRNLDLFEFGNYLQGDIVRLFFSKKDYTCIPQYYDDPRDEDAEPYTKHVYKTTVERVKQRLDALGYSLFQFEKEFERLKNEALYYDAFLSHLHVDSDLFEDKAKGRFEKYVSFKKWCNSMNKIVTYELAQGKIWTHSNDNIEDIGISTECDKVIYYSLKKDNNEAFYGIKLEQIHPGYVVRLVLESCTPSDEIELDFSNLDNWAEDCIPKAIAASEIDEKIIVLVEGTSDKSILEFALEKFYPHLSDLFYFMDFEEENATNGKKHKRDGGTSFLIKNLHLFFYSRLKARFIAIFDNDAEGYKSWCELDDARKWPDNFRILQYPDNTLFTSYPTILPNGTICDDNITKKACSIELYLPNSIIQDNNTYYPIEWESRIKINHNNTSDYKYQGVISQKDRIKKEVFELIADIKENNAAFVESDWERTKQIIDSIVFAFST